MRDLNQPESVHQLLHANTDLPVAKQFRQLHGAVEDNLRRDGSVQVVNFDLIVTLKNTKTGRVTEYSLTADGTKTEIINRVIEEGKP